MPGKVNYRVCNPKDLPELTSLMHPAYWKAPALPIPTKLTDQVEVFHFRGILIATGSNGFAHLSEDNDSDWYPPTIDPVNQCLWNDAMGPLQFYIYRVATPPPWVPSEPRGWLFITFSKELVDQLDYNYRSHQLTSFVPGEEYQAELIQNIREAYRSQWRGLQHQKCEMLEMQAPVPSGTFRFEGTDRTIYQADHMQPIKTKWSNNVTYTSSETPAQRLITVRLCPICESKNASHL